MEKLLVAHPWNVDHRSADIGQRGCRTPVTVYETLRKIGASFGAEVVGTKLGPLRSTVSVGVCFGDDEAGSLEQLLLGADAALYAAKRAGRNRVATAETAGSGAYREPELLLA